MVGPGETEVSTERMALLFTVSTSFPQLQDFRIVAVDVVLYFCCCCFLLLFFGLLYDRPSGPYLNLGSTLKFLFVAASCI